MDVEKLVTITIVTMKNHAFKAFKNVKRDLTVFEASNVDICISIVKISGQNSSSRQVHGLAQISNEASVNILSHRNKFMDNSVGAGRERGSAVASSPGTL